MVRRITEWCSFYGKPNDDDMKLIIAGRGPNPPFICDECVDLCAEIVAEQRREPRQMTAEDIGL